MSETRTIACVVAVRFSGSDRTYDYLCDFAPKIGEQVLVDTRRGEQNVEVVEIKPNSERATAWIKSRAGAIF